MNKAIPAALVAAALIAGCATQSEQTPEARQAPDLRKHELTLNQDCASQGAGTVGDAAIRVCVPEGGDIAAQDVLGDTRIRFARASANTRRLGPGDVNGLSRVANEYGTTINLGPFNYADSENESTLITSLTIYPMGTSTLSPR
jgi:hypothetical protein